MRPARSLFSRLSSARLTLSLTELRHLTLVNADLATFSRNPRFGSLVALVLISVTLSDPWVLRRWAMPVLRRLSIVDCSVSQQPGREQLWTTDLLSQLELVEIGESRRVDAHTGLIIPLTHLPDPLNILWHVDVDSALVRLPFPRPRAALRRHAFVRLVVHGADPASSPDRTNLGVPQRSRADKVLDILALLPNLELLLIPRGAWPAPPHSGPAPAWQKAIIDECARRGIALRTYERRKEGEGFVPEFAAFLREREEDAASEARKAAR